MDSLERSLARREHERVRAAAREARHRQPRLPVLLWRELVCRPLVMLTGAGAVLTLALLAATHPSVSDGRGPQSATAGSPRLFAPPAIASSVIGRRHGCRLSAGTSGYANPLAAASVTARRIDQGVDYRGTGTLTAIGNAKVTAIALVDTGWPGAFISYQLLDGPDAGCFVFYAEGVTPASSLRIGETLRPGQAVATLIPHYADGIEIGWASGRGTGTYAAQRGGWDATHENENIPSTAGMHFSALIAALGGPPGKVETGHREH